jgi:hypothetical protein
MRPLSGKALFCDKFPYLRSKALKVAIVTRVLQVVAQSIWPKLGQIETLGSSKLNGGMRNRLWWSCPAVTTAI